MTDAPTTARQAAEAISLTTVVGAIMGWLPAIATALAIVWYIVQIWESATVQRWRSKLKRNHTCLTPLPPPPMGPED